MAKRDRRVIICVMTSQLSWKLSANTLCLRLSLDIKDPVPESQWIGSLTKPCAPIGSIGGYSSGTFKPPRKALCLDNVPQSQWTGSLAKVCAPGRDL